MRTAVTLSSSALRIVRDIVDASAGPFRRSHLSEALYPTTRPRSRVTANAIADRALSHLSREGAIERSGHLHWIMVSSTRILKSGRPVAERSEVVSLPLRTRCPDKWVAVDLETGEVWRGTPGGEWQTADVETRRDVAAVLGDGSSPRRTRLLA